MARGSSNQSRIEYTIAVQAFQEQRPDFILICRHESGTIVPITCALVVGDYGHCRKTGKQNSVRRLTNCNSGIDSSFLHIVYQEGSICIEFGTYLIVWKHPRPPPT